MTLETLDCIYRPRRSAVDSPTDTNVLPALLPQAPWVVLVSTIKDCFALHDPLHGVKIRLPEEVPLGSQNKRVGIVDRRHTDGHRGPT